MSVLLLSSHFAWNNVVNILFWVGSYVSNSIFCKATSWKSLNEWSKIQCTLTMTSNFSTRVNTEQTFIGDNLVNAYFISDSFLEYEAFREGYLTFLVKSIKKEGRPSSQTIVTKVGLLYWDPSRFISHLQFQ